MSIIDEKNNDVATPAVDRERISDPHICSVLKKELSDTLDNFLKQHTVQLAVSYALGHLTEDINNGGSFAEDILFGLRWILKWSAESAEEHAFHTEDVIRLLSKLYDLQKENDDKATKDKIC